MLVVWGYELDVVGSGRGYCVLGRRLVDFRFYEAGVVGWLLYSSSVMGFGTVYENDMTRLVNGVIWVVLGDLLGVDLMWLGVGGG